MARILFTGASGFIGEPTLRLLLDAGHVVTALSRHRPNLEHPALAWVECDLVADTALPASIAEVSPDVLMHLAWQGIPDFSLEMCQRNLVMSQNIITTALDAGVKRVLVTGSCFEYNRVSGCCHEGDHSLPRDHFTWSKLALLEWLKMQAEKAKVDWGWMRVFYAYGPRQREASLIPALIKAISKGETPDIRTPTARNDFVFVDDVAKGLVAAVGAAKLNGIYNLGRGASMSIHDICVAVDQHLTGARERADAVLANATAPSDVNFWAHAEKSKTELGWVATTALSDGIAQTCGAK